MPDKIIPITLDQAAQKFDVPVRILKEWGRSGKIAYAKNGASLMTDENSVRCYLELKASLVRSNKYLEKITREKQEEVNEIISKYDDFLFSLRGLDTISPLFRIMINGMALLLSNKRMQKPFIDISCGQSIYDAAQSYGVTYDKMCSLYQDALRVIGTKTNFLKDYRNRLAKLEYRLRELSVLNNYIGMRELSQTDIDLSSPIFMRKGSLPTSLEDILSLSLEKDLKIETRSVNAFKSNDIYTVGDLYTFVGKFGFERLLCFDRFGEISLHRLKNTLRKNGLLDSNDNSPLLDFFRK